MAPSGSQTDSDKAARQLIARAIKHSGKGREQIANGMSKRLGCRITLHMLNRFTSEAKGKARFPAAWVEAFCEVVGDDRLQRFIMGQRLRGLVRLGEVELEKKGLLGTFGRRRSRPTRSACRK